MPLVPACPAQAAYLSPSWLQVRSLGPRRKGWRRRRALLRRGLHTCPSIRIPLSTPVCAAGGWLWAAEGDGACGAGPVPVPQELPFRLQEESSCRFICHVPFRYHPPCTLRAQPLSRDGCKRWLLSNHVAGTRGIQRGENMSGPIYKLWLLPCLLARVTANIERGKKSSLKIPALLSRSLLPRALSVLTRCEPKPSMCMCWGWGRGVILPSLLMV